uniref:KH-like RNA-binding domain-containing protein n=1 Tax=Nannospalax galili TaxID=1026970 RepID=A0A8C6R6A7_NANGA
MEPLPTRTDVPPWVIVPEDLKDPEVFLNVLKSVTWSEASEQDLLELKPLEASDLTEVMVYGNCLYKLRTRRMLQSMPERIRQRLAQGMIKLEEAMQSLELGQ